MEINTILIEAEGIPDEPIVLRVPGVESPGDFQLVIAVLECALSWQGTGTLARGGSWCNLDLPVPGSYP